MTHVDQTHAPTLSSWVASASGHREFPIQNLPLGLFSPPNEAPRAGMAIGDEIIEVQALMVCGLLQDAPSITDLLGNPPLRKSVRQQMSRLLSEERFRAHAEAYLYTAADCTLHLPTQIGDYTDFYAGIHHAVTVGKLFRPDNPLLPNYKHVPIGYHGRASSVRPTGTPVIRPKGQTKSVDADGPDFGPSRRLDFELELGIWIGATNDLGEPVPIAQAADHIAGYCLLNDWSARDFQAWEYQPLGPFLAKNFLTTISPWVITPEALAPFRAAQDSRPDGDPRPLPYLWDETDQAFGA